MSVRPTRMSSNLSPLDIELQENKDEQVNVNDAQKKKKVREID